MVPHVENEKKIVHATHKKARSMAGSEIKGEVSQISGIKLYRLVPIVSNIGSSAVVISGMPWLPMYCWGGGAGLFGGRLPIRHILILAFRICFVSNLLK